MKRYIYSLLALCMAMTFTACDDDTENPYAHESSITIVKQDVIFDAAAATGTITVNAPAGITKVETAANWVTTSTADNTITVNVTQNNGIFGRSSLVTIWSGTDSANVVVQQRGMVFQSETGNSIHLSDQAQTRSYGVKTNVDIKVSTSENWLKASLEGDSLTITTEQNATGHLRRGNIIYAAGDKADTIKVVQYDFKADIRGDYKLYATNAAGQSYQPFDVYLSERYLEFSSMGWSFPVTFDENTATFSLQAGQYIGRIGNYYLFCIFFSSTGYWTAYYTNSYATMRLEYDDENGTTGRWGGRFGSNTIDALMLERFASRNLTQDADAGTYGYLYDTHIVKVKK